MILFFARQSDADSVVLVPGHVNGVIPREPCTITSGGIIPLGPHYIIVISPHLLAPRSRRAGPGTLENRRGS
jgi:hypothetical protein